MFSKRGTNEKNPFFLTGSSSEVLSEQQCVQKSPKEHLDVTSSTSPVAYASFLVGLRIVFQHS